MVQLAAFDRTRPEGDRRLRRLLYGVPNPDILLSPLSAQEAVLSSRIEGTQSSLSEVLALDANGAHKTKPLKRGRRRGKFSTTASHS